MQHPGPMGAPQHSLQQGGRDHGAQATLLTQTTTKCMRRSGGKLGPAEDVKQAKQLAPKGARCRGPEYLGKKGGRASIWLESGGCGALVAGFKLPS